MQHFGPLVKASVKRVLKKHNIIYCQNMFENTNSYVHKYSFKVNKYSSKAIGFRAKNY